MNTPDACLLHYTRTCCHQPLSSPRNQNSIFSGLRRLDTVQGRAKTTNSLAAELRFSSESDTSFYSLWIPVVHILAFFRHNFVYLRSPMMSIHISMNVDIYHQVCLLYVLVLLLGERSSGRHGDWQADGVGNKVWDATRSYNLSKWCSFSCLATQIHFSPVTLSSQSWFGRPHRTVEGSRRTLIIMNKWNYETAMKLD